MGGQQGHKARARPGDLQGLEGLGMFCLGGGDCGIVEPLQCAQGVNHAFTPRQPGTTRIGPELAPAREPADYQRPQDGENYLEDHDQDELKPAAWPAPFGPTTPTRSPA